MFELFSPNMLKTFEMCPIKFNFRYIKGINMPVDNEIFETGKNVHALASYYLRKENISSLEKSLSKYEMLLWNNLKNVAYFQYLTLKTEYNLSVKIQNKFFGGRIDALVLNENCYYILDYKTGALPKSPTYDYQTMVYMLCVSTLYNTDNVKFVYLDVKNNQECVITLNPDLITEYKQRLIDVADKIEKLDLCAGKCGCKSCEYRKICYEKILN